MSANLNPLLVDYNECMDYHIQIINSLNLHLSKILKKKDKQMPNNLNYDVWLIGPGGMGIEYANVLSSLQKIF